MGIQPWRLGTWTHSPGGWGHLLACTQTQPGHVPSHGHTARGTTDMSMSPSPRCSAASLVNWESEMKHCSSGREELLTLRTPTTPWHR